MRIPKSVRRLIYKRQGFVSAVLYRGVELATDKYQQNRRTVASVFAGVKAGLQEEFKEDTNRFW